MSKAAASSGFPFRARWRANCSADDGSGFRLGDKILSPFHSGFVRLFHFLLALRSQLELRTVSNSILANDEQASASVTAKRPRFLSFLYQADSGLPAAVALDAIGA
jgi:hypothetical protein